MSQCKVCLEFSEIAGRPVCEAIRAGRAYRIIVDTLPLGDEHYIDVDNPECQAGIASRRNPNGIKAFQENSTYL